MVKVSCMVWVEYIWWVGVVVSFSSLPLACLCGCRVVLFGGGLVWFGVIILYSFHNYFEYLMVILVVCW